MPDQVTPQELPAGLRWECAHVRARRRSRVWAATGLLGLGVSLCSAGAETGNVLYSVGGLLLLLFVPALIVEATRVDCDRDTSDDTRPAPRRPQASQNRTDAGEPEGQAKDHRPVTSDECTWPGPLRVPVDSEELRADVNDFISEYVRRVVDADPPWTTRQELVESGTQGPLRAWAEWSRNRPQDPAARFECGFGVSLHAGYIRQMYGLPVFVAAPLAFDYWRLVTGPGGTVLADGYVGGGS